MAKQLSQYMVVSLAENVTALCRVLPVCQSDHSNGPVDTAYKAFRDLSAGLYDIDTTRYSRGVTREDAPGVKLANGLGKAHLQEKQRAERKGKVS